MYNLLIQLGVVIILVILAIIIYFKLRKSRSIRILNASLTVEELELRAKRTAIDHVLTTKRVLLNWPVTRVNESYKKILDLYTELNDNLNHKRSVPPAAEWLLDNFYIIEEQVKGIRADMSKKSYYRLPVLRKGPFKGYTRVFAIAMEFTESVDGQIEESTLLRYLEAYQAHTILFDREIRMIPMMLRIALIESTRSLCENISKTQVMWNKANEIVDKWWSDDISDPDKIVKLFKNTIESMDEVNPSFIEHLFYRLRRSGRNYSSVLRYIDEHLETLGTDTERVAQVEHNTQAVSTVSMGNYIMSFRYISSVNWSSLFDSLSFVEQILDKDPMGNYSSMDSASCSYYVSNIEKLAKQYGVSELHVAREAIALAHKAEEEIDEKGEADNETLRRAHVGYYLIDKGIDTLLKGLKGKKVTRPTKFLDWSSDNKVTLFIGSIAIFTGFIVLIAYNIALKTNVNHYGNTQTVILGILSCLALTIPASELVIVINNWIIGTIKRPSIFPRLELKEGIPNAMKTMVVVPALLSDNARIDVLLENIENHYLSNREEHLYFALIGAFTDTKSPDPTADQALLDHALKGVETLNTKYKRGEEDKFYFYHRKSVYNEKDDVWTGWERKRGALMEFNAMLLGSTATSFIHYAQNCLNGNDIKYIITLDADTVLPFDMAKKMIGTMAHPLNLPVIDNQRQVVSEGYGLMQPRVTFDMDSSNKSAFARIFTGLVGMDPYASAVSDVYQDLFGEGIFTGKGIYDLKVFYRVLKDVVPENAVLSHDLLEGSYVRAALVSDLELVDAYPSRYNSYIARLQRWIRGDWQLIPWLNKIIYNKNNRLVLNPLSNISIWKIFDNLRRSLVAPSLMVLTLLGLTILPGSGYFWIGFVGLVMWMPFIIVSIDQLSIKKLVSHTAKRHITGFFGLKASFFQILLNMMFLPYQATMTLKAILVTLVRVFITKKKLLEWVTSDDAEKMQINTLRGYWSTMGFSAFLGIPLVILTALYKPDVIGLAIGIFALWIMGPFVAYSISKTSNLEIERLDADALLELRKTARRTWRYFEEYANAKNNYLAPDNVQVVPYKGIAHRTSPTNIGLGLLASLTARDFGYIGLQETIGNINKTITTIEKLDKWHGHLLNWYDTKTLIPLRPRYISTVDSGNLVCYYVTLAEGLKTFEALPILDKVYFRGFEDTVRNSKEMDTTIETHLSELKNDNPLDLYTGYVTLQKLIDETSLPEMEKDVWKTKGKQQLIAIRREIVAFMPWIELIDSAPDKIDDELLKLLRKNCAMSELGETINQIRLAVDAHKIKLNSQEFLESLSWLNKLCESLDVATANNTIFIKELKRLITRIEKLSNDTEFIHLYDERRQLFSIGFNVEFLRLTKSYYDLLASEARQTSYIAIARGEIPAKHWNKLGRSLTMVDRYKGLVSWSGTMFEYLMPLILMRSYKNTLLDETYSFAVKSQIKYGNQRNMPWGASESAFNSLDLNLDYQYKAIGVPWLGLKRGLIEDAVIAPYATFLALMVDPVSSYKNIERLKKEGLEGQYGYYEAADYTQERLKDNENSVIIRSYMAHHQGMTLMSLNNYLNGNVLQNRFSKNVEVKAARLLLQEKVPMHLIFTKENKEKIVPFKGTLYKEINAIRSFITPNEILPKAHVLSNGYYSVVTTDRGTGYSHTKDMAVTRWREDSVHDQYGMFFYLKNNEANKTWSSAYAPYNVLPENYEVIFTSDKTTYKRTDGDIDTLTEIVVTSGDNAEVRRIKVKNNGEETNTIELTSYFELVINKHNNDMAHPAFSNLFMETEYNAEYKALLAHRRPRKAGEKDQWIAQIAVVDGEIFGEYQYETDRMQFIGRGNTLKNPVSMQRDKPLSNSLGIVLDPVFSFRLSLKLKPKESMRISFVTMVADSQEAIMELLTKYNNIETCDAAFWLAVIRSQVETRYLNINAEEMILYQNMVSDILYLSPIRKQYETFMKQNKKGQSSLWAYGISGDRPILLLSMETRDDVEILYEILKAHEYWRLKDLRVDLVIRVKEETSYFNPLKALVNEIVESVQTGDAARLRGDIFILNDNNLDKEDLYLLYAVARMSFDAQNGSMETQYNAAYERISTLEDSQVFISKAIDERTLIDPIHNPIQDPIRDPIQDSIQDSIQDTLHDPDNLQFFNGIGGFSADGTVYKIHLENEQMTPLPWSNVIANKDFGFLTTESGGGYTWYGNSRENKLTPWSNDAVSDTPSEIIYLSEDTTTDGISSQDLWTITALPIREIEPYTIEHGFGYTKYLHTSHGMTQELTQFVPLEGAAKISLIALRNDSEYERALTVTYYAKPVLGDFESNTAMHLNSDVSEGGTLTVINPYNQDFPNQVLFMETSIAERSVCGNRREFVGNGSFQSPEILTQKRLNNHVGSGQDTCLAMQVTLKIKPLETVKLAFVLGIAETQERITMQSNQFRSVEMAEKTLRDVKAFWREKLTRVQVETPDPAMNILLNGWLIYQVITCRMWARTAFYQAGGAFGFRDQLQDSLAVLTIWPELAKEQILKHAAHQFVEGDVLHWWHEPAEKGPRTRMSDDFLWLPYVVSEYVTVTGDQTILDEIVTFLEDAPLEPHEEERYSSPVVSSEVATLYAHCIRALDHGLNFGDHGLPLMGGGDWNDGMNTVGNEGRGESIWLGWFLYKTLKMFIPHCTARGDHGSAEKYQVVARELANALDEHGWDGKWYKRAYFDDGSVLGTESRSECKIDAIAQAWSVMSGAGDPQKSMKAMASVEDYLINKEEGLIKLLIPPFDKGDMEPGYIKGYVPGVRENGGQYTHAATWVIAAFAMLGEGDKAHEYFELINPINHSNTYREMLTYKTEPYVMAADVYSCYPHVGRGGWTWYTGAAGWMYQVGIEYILGFRKEGDVIKSNPNAPLKWGDVTPMVHYKPIDKKKEN